MKSPKRKSKAIVGEEEGVSSPSSYLALKDVHPTSPSPTPSSNPFHLIPKRYIMCGLIFLSNILCYADRTNISIAVLPGNIPLKNEFETGQVSLPPALTPPRPSLLLRSL